MMCSLCMAELNSSDRRGALVVVGETAPCAVPPLSGQLFCSECLDDIELLVEALKKDRVVLVRCGVL